MLNKIQPSKIIVYGLPFTEMRGDITIYTTIHSSAFDCISDFEDALIWDGKSFWNAEKDMKWVDC